MRTLFFVLCMAFQTASAQADDCTALSDSSIETLISSNDSACLSNSELRARFEIAALEGSPDAARLLADYFYEGAGDSESEAIKWLRAYHRNAGTAPSVLLAQLLLRSENPVEVEDGRRILSARARGGDAQSAELLGDAFASSNDLPAAIVWFQQAAMLGRPTAMEKLADVYLRLSDEAADVLAALWMFVASKQYEENSFKNRTLRDSALQIVSRTAYESNAIEDFAEILGRSIEKRSAVKEDLCCDSHAKP